MNKTSSGLILDEMELEWKNYKDEIMNLWKKKKTWWNTHENSSVGKMWKEDVFIVHVGRAILYVIINQQFQRRLLVDNESAGNGQCSYICMRIMHTSRWMEGENGKRRRHEYVMSMYRLSWAIINRHESHILKIAIHEYFHGWRFCML